MSEGLLAISEGMMLLSEDDNRIIETSLLVYDSFYAYFRAHHLLEARGLRLPDHGNKGPTLPTEFLRRLLKETGAATH